MENDKTMNELMKAKTAESKTDDEFAREFYLMPKMELGLLNSKRTGVE